MRKLNTRKIMVTLIMLVMCAVWTPFLTKQVMAASEIGAEILVPENAVPGDEVTIDILIKDNPGILGVVMKLEYDSSLTLKSAKNGVAFMPLTLTKPGEFVSGCKFVWDGQELAAEDIMSGTILSLTFAISEDAKVGTELPISVNFEDAVDKDLNSIQIAGEEGRVCLTEEKTAKLSYITASKELVKYKVGDKLNVDDIQVIAIYSDGTSKQISEFKTNAASINMAEAGDKELTIYYEENDIAVTSVILIQIVANDIPTLDSIKVEKTKKTYQIGDKITIDDLNVTAIYSDKTTKELALNDYTTNVDEITTDRAGDVKLIVTYTQGGIQVNQVIVLTIKEKTPLTQPTTPIQPTPAERPGNAGDQKTNTASAIPRKVNILKLKALGKKKISIKWSKSKDAFVYVVQISTKKNFKGAKQKMCGNTKYTCKKLKKGKTYYVRVRVASYDKQWSAWSKVKKIKVK